MRQRPIASGLEQIIHVLQGDVTAVVQEGLAQSQNQVPAGMAAFSPLQTPHVSWVHVGFLAQAVAGQPGPGAELEKGFGELQSVSSRIASFALLLSLAQGPTWEGWTVPLKSPGE